MTGRRPGEEGVLTPEQRQLLKKRVDAAMRERLSTMARKGARPSGHMRKAQQKVKS